MSKPNLKLFDPGFLDCKHFIQLLTSSKKHMELFNSQAGKYISDLIAKLTKLHDLCLLMRTNRTRRNFNWYQIRYEKQYPPPQEPSYYDEYQDEAEFYDEYQDWERYMVEECSFRMKENDFIIIKLNYYIKIIKQILLDLDCLISHRHNEVFGIEIDSIYDLEPYSYVYINKATRPKLVYIVFIDYKKNLIWYQDTRQKSSRDILDFERKWETNDTAILNKIKFNEVFHIIPNITPSRKKIILDLKDKDLAELSGSRFNISNGFYQKYINPQGGKFSLEQYYDICYLINKIKKFLKDPNSNIYFEFGHDPYSVSDYYNIPAGYLYLYHHVDLIYDYIKFYDKLVDDHYYDNFVYNKRDQS